MRCQEEGMSFQVDGNKKEGDGNRKKGNEKVLTRAYQVYTTNVLCKYSLRIL